MTGKFLLDTNAIVAIIAIIAACALEEQATLISNDAVFTRINGLSLMIF